MRLAALLQARNEERFLPGWLANVPDAVDGIVALDDGSSDATAALLAAHPKVVEVITKPPGAAWDERGNHMALIAAGRRHGAGWFLCVDADERLERRFAAEIGGLLDRADRDGIDAYTLQLREMWNDRRHYRVDGIWGGKARYRLFRNNPEHRRFDPRRLHRYWMPLELVASLDRTGGHSEFNLYHLRMVDPEDRRARWARYKAIDPQNLYQREGYDYLVDESGLVLAEVPPERDFLPLADPAVPDRRA